MSQRIREWIRRRPIVAFFLFGIAMFFGTMFPALLIYSSGDLLAGVLAHYLGRLGAYSPVLAGMFVSHTLQPGRMQISFGRRLMVFLPVWFIAAIISTANLRQSAPPDLTWITLIVLSLLPAILPALVITSAISGTDGVRHMLATLVRPKGGLVYYVFALLVFPIIHVAGTVITNILDGRAWFPLVNQGAELALTAFISFFSVLLFSGGINEESGWRGFAQRRLQAKYSPLIANIILWFGLVIWHIPNDIVQYQNGGYLLIRIGLYPFITILFGWVYNRTHGSILAPAIFHASMNAMNPLARILPIATAGNILLVSLAIIVVVSDRMWRRLPGDHPAVHQEIILSASG